MIWLSALGWLRSAIRAVLALVVKYPLQVALCASLLACGYLWRGWSHERAAHRADIAAGQANLALLKAEKAATEARQAQITKETDHATQPARDSALDAALRYAAAHRCMSPAAVAAAGPASAGLPEPSATPGSPETPSEAVAVPEWGVTNCALNSADLQTAYEWAQRIYGSN